MGREFKVNQRVEYTVHLITVVACTFTMLHVGTKINIKRNLDDSYFQDRMVYDSNVPCVISCTPDLTSCDLSCTSDDLTTTSATLTSTTAVVTTTAITTTTAPKCKISCQLNQLLSRLKPIWLEYRIEAGVTALTVTG